MKETICDCVASDFFEQRIRPAISVCRGYSSEHEHREDDEALTGDEEDSSAQVAPIIKLGVKKTKIFL